MRTQLSINVPPRLVYAAPIRALAVAILFAGQAAIASEAATFDVSGDVRLRYDSVETDPGPDSDRGRYRARVGFEAGWQSSLRFHLRVATGDGNPVSTNLDFGESVSFDELQLDRAYVEWSVTESGRVYAGKMKNPLYRPGDVAIAWDSDFNPEGIAAVFGRGPAFASLAAFQVADYSHDDSLLFTAQVGRHWSIGDAELTTGLGYYDYTHARGHVPFYRGIAAGNTVDAAGNYVYDYDIAEMFVQYAMRARGVPLEFFGTWLRNLEADRANRAWAVGVNAGDAGERGQLAATWAWHDTASDALVGTYNDSDFAGGLTDSRGQLLRFQYALTDRWVLGGTLVLAESGEPAGRDRDYDRVMLDIEMRF